MAERLPTSGSSSSSIESKSSFLRPGRRRSISETAQDDQKERREYVRLRVDHEMKAEFVKWATQQRWRSLTSKEKINMALLQAKLRNEERKDRGKA